MIAAPGISRGTLCQPSIVVGALILAIVLLMGVAAPWLGTVDPAAINPSLRNKAPGSIDVVQNVDGSKVTVAHRMGTDTLGRDVYSRVVYGARASMLIGLAVAVVSVA